MGHKGDTSQEALRHVTREASRGWTRVMQGDIKMPFCCRGSFFIVIYAFCKQRAKLELRKENAILEIENKLKQKNLIMYQVGDKTQERSIISSDVRTQCFDCLPSLGNIVRANENLRKSDISSDVLKQSKLQPALGVPGLCICWFNQLQIEKYLEKKKQNWVCTEHVQTIFFSLVIIPQTIQHKYLHRTYNEAAIMSHLD